MAGNVRCLGTVVEAELPDGSPAPPTEGLYLRTKDGERLALVGDIMAVQMPMEMVHRRCRREFEPYLGKVVTVSGYRSGGTIWGAMVEKD
jgi:hypothetical protein